ncbi:TPR domain lipoprotein [Geotalea daltonii FRC-32]|uniref:TPR domain lipoprotein n=1 Tax=Geotalea daltonii (strain DSM 22248 / JCM 15807 / FRC-32) TaxID=316067 RepID=B9M690_GEODF|nr:tetratricopeptide repeat protein [Geotalea daltonii]ACM21878.2 TPR domain lipoprotein [Geotalea daltonii FRC-32]
MKRFLFMIWASAAILLSACAMSHEARKQSSYHYQMGLSYLGENNFTSALVEFSEAEKLDPKNPELLNYLGMVYFRKHKFDIAEQKYLKALKIRPLYSEARNNLAVNYLEMKRWDDAITQLKLVAEDIFYQNQDTAAVNLGLAYFGKGDHQQALAVYRSAVSSYPRDARVRLNLGRVYFALDKVDWAIAEYGKALELSGNYANAHYFLALAYMKTKDNKAAAAAFREVIRIAPDSEIGQFAREYVDMLK